MVHNVPIYLRSFKGHMYFLCTWLIWVGLYKTAVVGKLRVHFRVTWAHIFFYSLPQRNSVHRINYKEFLIENYCQQRNITYIVCQRTPDSYIFGSSTTYDRSSLPCTQVRPDRGSNSWRPDHNSTVHVTETPALTTRPSVTSSSCHWDACSELNWIELNLVYLHTKHIKVHHRLFHA